MNSYRKISKIPPPEFSSFMADEWVDQLRIAFSGRMKENNIDFSVSADKQVKEIIADRKLLNQVMVNLINNSFDAVMENVHEKIISVHIMRNRQDKVLISVRNNGALIDPGLADKIFVPFFTTKTNGSGIGLSISQEIMKMHNGSIVAISNDHEQTTFLAEF